MSYKLFQNTVTDVASATVDGYRVSPNHNSLSARGHADLAVTVVAALMIMRDPLTDRPGSAFGVMYSAVVSDAELPAEYDDVVTMGQPMRYALTGRSVAVLSNGMKAYTTCMGGFQLRRGAYNGSFGWPCLIGGSIAVTRRDADGSYRNCMVFYLPLRNHENGLSGQPMFPADFHVKLKHLDTSLEICWQEWLASRDPIVATGQRPKLDLTAMALCVHRNYPEPELEPSSGLPRTRYHWPRARGVMMLPGAVDSDGSVVHPEPFGFWTPYGHLLFVRLDLPPHGGSAAVSNPGRWVTCVCALDRLNLQ